MKKRGITWLVSFLPLIAIGWILLGSPSDVAPAGTVAVNMTVTVEAKHGGEVPTISCEDVRVLQDGARVRVTDWVPLQDNRAALELYVLIDDAADASIGMQFDDLRQFMNAQPPTTLIALGYIGFGTVEVAQTFTKDHYQAAKALRLPMGVGAGIGSPYDSIQTLIKNWPKSNARRREILMVTSGDGKLEDPNDPYLLSAIEQAQRAGIQVHVIYGIREDQSGIIWAESNLAQLAEATGGGAYFPSLPSFAPFLGQITNRLKHQYELTFLVNAGVEASYRSVQLETEVPNAKLVAADKVFVPAANLVSKLARHLDAR